MLHLTWLKCLYKPLTGTEIITFKCKVRSELEAFFHYYNSMNIFKCKVKSELELNFIEY